MFSMFSGLDWNWSIRVSVCVQNSSFCQSAGWGIKSHDCYKLVSPLIILLTVFTYEIIQLFEKNVVKITGKKNLRSACCFYMSALQVF